MEYLQKKQDEILDGFYAFFKQKINDNPDNVLRQRDDERQSLYIRFDHGWTGRGIDYRFNTICFYTGTMEGSGLLAMVQLKVLTPKHLFNPWQALP